MIDEKKLRNLLARWRRHNAERTATGYWREYREHPAFWSSGRPSEGAPGWTRYGVERAVRAAKKSV